MKDCLILGPASAFHYDEVFPLLRDNVLRLGHKGYLQELAFWFIGEDGKKHRIASTVFTTLQVRNRERHFTPTKTYNPQDFQAYDNYNAINVDRVKDIPYDYEGVIGVPITIFQYDLDNVEIVGFSQGELFIECGGIGASKKFVDDYYKNGGSGQINEGWKHVVFYSDNGKPVTPYQRIFIRKKKLFKTTNPNRS